MAQKGIREYDAKRLLATYLPEFTNSVNYEGKVLLVDPDTNLKKLKDTHSWLNNEKLVVKPDQLFGKRGKHGLLCLNADFITAKKWIEERINKKFKVGSTEGTLTHFLIEQFVPHEEEYYVAIKSERLGDTIYFSVAGGVDIEENWDQVNTLTVPVLDSIEDHNLEKLVCVDTNENKQVIIDFIKGLFQFYQQLGFTYLEINPFAISGNNITPLDTVARIDDTASFECGQLWGDLQFPTSFGRTVSPESQKIEQLDAKSGSSLKLTILNPDGRIWLMVAGGGASVIYTDTVVDLGQMKELANYGEYSGNPSKDETKVYAETILDLMTRKKHPEGKALLIGGGIANFTDVAKTFTGIIEALKNYRKKLMDNKVKIFVRRGGPNYQAGLMMMRDLGKELGVPIEVYGPETHMSKIVPMAINALGLKGGK